MKKFDLFPGKYFELSSPMSAQDALCALGKEMYYAKSIYVNLPFEETGGKKFKGSINKNSFEAIRYSPLFHIYNEIRINGKVDQDEKGSKISLSFNLRKDTKISFLIVALIPVLFSLYVSVFSTKDPLVFLIVSVFIIGIYLVERLITNFKIKLILKKFKKIFCA